MPKSQSTTGRLTSRILVTATTFPRWKNDTEPAFVYELSRRLAGQGYQVDVLVPHHPGAARFESMGGMRIHRFQYFWPAFMQKLCYDGGILPNIRRSFLAMVQVPFLVLAECCAVRRLARKNKYALIHAHWAVPQGYIANRVKQGLGTKYVVTVHAGDVFPLRNSFFRHFAKKAIRNADHCTANSTYTAEKIRSLFGKGNNKENNTDSPTVSPEIIPMGVDFSMFSRKSRPNMKARLGIAGKMILSVGRLAEKKGISYLLEAMPAVIKSNKNAKLVIVGDGPEKKILQDKAEGLRISKSVIFTGKVRNELLPSYYSSADVFVLPSIIAEGGDTEGLGVVLLESIAAGTPVVASNVGGIPDIVKNGKTGLLVPQKKPQLLALAINRILKNNSLAKSLAKNGLVHIRQAYSWEKIASRFAKAFKQVLTTSRKQD
ncbi:glycosyltransferase family 4 protein [Candidatus Woesearchaeota archaeon]|nr:glycosyltransferase family 4 protein [Candidatus Woesearchaeota archaeon]